MDESGQQPGTAIDRSAEPPRERRTVEGRGSDRLNREADTTRPPAGANVPSEARPIVVPPSSLSFRNVRMMHLLERIAHRFNEAKVPLMALKGAALTLTLYERPDQRPMGDLDLMVRHEDIEAACALLEAMGGLRGEPLVRDDFFPRFHYELEFTLGSVYPVKIDLHVRPFRPVRYARTVPDDALWQGAESVSVGKATVLIPSTEDMLIHLCVHAAIHGCSQRKWINEIGQWVHSKRRRIDWEQFVENVRAWGLALPVRSALAVAEPKSGPVVPDKIDARLSQIRVSWRDRLALWQAPRDAAHPITHVAADLLCTPGLRFRVSYLRAVVFPGRAHMAEWYGLRHPGWLLIAHILRCLGPVGRLLRGVLGSGSRIEVKRSPIHGLGVFATRDIAAGGVVARYYGRKVERGGIYVVWRRKPRGRKERFEITGRLRFLNHSCRPNARFSGFALKAMAAIRDGDEITIEYEGARCTCERGRGHTPPCGVKHAANASAAITPKLAG